jgi:hypothetical protein
MSERDQALRHLLDAIETMDQKITPYGERDDGTILHYIVADSTWHRILAAARNPRWSDASVDVALLTKAIRNVRESDPAEWLDRGDEADAIYAEYVHLARP